MPITKENRALYPPRQEWQRIRLMILDRAGHKCEFCGVRNYAEGYRDADGVFHELRGAALDVAAHCDGMKVIRIVLTIAHLDHNPGNNQENNLRALCQRCHLGYDQQHHAENAAATRARKKRRRAKKQGQQFLYLGNAEQEPRP